MNINNICIGDRLYFDRRMLKKISFLEKKACFLARSRVFIIQEIKSQLSYQGVEQAVFPKRTFYYVS